MRSHAGRLEDANPARGVPARIFFFSDDRGVVRLPLESPTVRKKLDPWPRSALTPTTLPLPPDRAFTTSLGLLRVDDFLVTKVATGPPDRYGLRGDRGERGERGDREPMDRRLVVPFPRRRADDGDMEDSHLKYPPDAPARDLDLVSTRRGERVARLMTRRAEDDPLLLPPALDRDPAEDLRRPGLSAAFLAEEIRAELGRRARAGVGGRTGPRRPPDMGRFGEDTGITVSLSSGSVGGSLWLLVPNCSPTPTFKSF